jgi:hypothetical protein
MAVTILLQLLDAAGRSLVLAGHLGAGLVADGRQLDGAARLLLLVAARGGGRVGRGRLGVGRASSSTGTVVVGLALVLLLLLAGLPLLSDLLELCDERKQLAS